MFFTLSPSYVSLHPALINVLSKSPGLVKPFLHEVKNPYTIDQPEADLLWAGSGPVLLIEIKN